MGVEIEDQGDGVVAVVINWPEKRNALGPTDTREVGDAMTQACSAAERGVVLTGVGAFCAGGDLEQFAALSASVETSYIRTTIYDNVHSVLRAIKSSPVPVAAAVDGPALGLGFDYALACDMCFVGENGWLQQAWALAGLFHGAGGSAFVQQAAGSRLWKLIAEQERLYGTQMQDLNLGEAVDGSALAAAVERLKVLGQLPRDVLEAYTRLYRAERWPSDAFFSDCADAQAQFIGSSDFRARADEILHERARR